MLKHLFPSLTIVAALAATSSVVMTQTASRSVWSGVFTDVQVKRGAAVYNVECATCHGEDLTGRDMGSPLTGPVFKKNWTNASVGDLFEHARKTMPEENPGYLSAQKYADLVALILSVNGFPAGNTELPADLAVLGQIKIDDKPAGDAR